MSIFLVPARCIVEEFKNTDKTASGIIVTGMSKEPTYRGRVIATGDGALLENGQKVPMDIKVGDEVIYTTFSGSPVKYGDKEYIILNERDILAVVS